MTTRFALSSPIETLRSIYGFAGGIPHPPRPNIRPTEPVGIVRLRPGVEASGEREWALVRWGLLPHWVADPAKFGTLPTARAETIQEKPSFKAPLRHRRCIVPADSFYEWTGQPGRKICHRIQPAAASERPMAFAALWDHWLGRDGSEIDTMALVTVPAAPALSHLGERMPALLAGPDIATWLDVRRFSPTQATAYLAPWTSSDFAIGQVTSRLDAGGRDDVDVM